MRASELAFEKGNCKFHISKISIFSAKKVWFLITYIAKIDGIFWTFEYIIIPMIFWQLSKTVFKTFLAQWGHPMPPFPQKVVEKEAHRNRVKQIWFQFLLIHLHLKAHTIFSYENKSNLVFCRFSFTEYSRILRNSLMA